MKAAVSGDGVPGVGVEIGGGTMTGGGLVTTGVEEAGGVCDTTGLVARVVADTVAGADILPAASYA